MSAALAGRPPGGLPSRSQIEGWDSAYLEHAAERWREWRKRSEELFEQHRRNLAAPAGTEWTGDAKDAALDVATDDLKVVRSQGETLDQAIRLASHGAQDIRAAQRDALAAMAEAEADGFQVDEFLSVTDTRPVDITTMAGRRTAAMEHAESVRWRAEQLLATDSLVGSRLTATAAELESIPFKDVGGDGVNQLLDNKKDGDNVDPSNTSIDDNEISASGGGWRYPWDPPPPADSAPGGGHWEISSPAYESGPDGGPPLGPIQPPQPWHKELRPVVGASSGLEEVVAPPPNGWGAQPAWTMQEAYKFRLVGEGFNGSPEHVQWVQRNDKWYQATWVSYDFETEHQRSMVPHNNAAGYMTINLGMNEWKPIDIMEVYRIQVDNPRLSLYLPTPMGGAYEMPSGRPVANAGG